MRPCKCKSQTLLKSHAIFIERLMKAGADRVGGREFLVLFLQMHSRTTFYFTNMYFDDLSFMNLL